MRFGFFGFIVALMLLAVPIARAEGIAAVVNKDIVTTTDLRDRAEMLLKSSGKRPSAEMIKRIQPQVLEALIAESVQLQEAQKQGISVSDNDVRDGLKKIAENNKMSLEQFQGLLRKQGIRTASIERQIRAQIGWGRVIQKVLRPRVIVGDSEIAAERARMGASAGKREYYLAEIFLPVTGKGDEKRVRGLANTLAKQIRGGKPFPVVARAQSQSASAAAGGMLGWVAEGQLEDALDRALVKLAKNKVSNPIKGEDGYYLLYVRDVRQSKGDAAVPDTILSIRELQIDGADMKDKELETLATQTAHGLSGCMDIAKVAGGDRHYKLAEREVAVSELSSDEKKAFGKFDIGRALEPRIVGSKATIAMVCGRKDTGSAENSDAAIERKIGLQRLDLLQKRYLRDLIAAAYIERRVCGADTR